LPQRLRTMWYPTILVAATKKAAGTAQLNPEVMPRLLSEPGLRDDLSNERRVQAVACDLVGPAAGGALADPHPAPALPDQFQRVISQAIVDRQEPFLSRTAPSRLRPLVAAGDRGGGRDCTNPRLFPGVTAQTKYMRHPRLGVFRAALLFFGSHVATDCRRRGFEYRDPGP